MDSIHVGSRAMSLNLGTILQAAAADRPRHVALRMDERVLTYAQLDRAARGVAASLVARGLAPGDKVALLVPNVPEFTIAYFGILYAGGAVVPINVLAAAPEVAYFLADSEAKLLVAHPLFAAPAKAGAQEAGVPLVLAGGGPGADTLEEMQEAAPLQALVQTPADQTAVILYTSGTTGKPKGAELTHSNLFVNCAFVVPRLLPPQDPDRFCALATLPLFHSFGQTCIQNATIARGGTFTLLPRFEPKKCFEILERDRVSLFAGVPTMYFALLHHEQERDYDLSSLAFCLTGGAPMPAPVMSAFERRFGVTIQEGFGLSETSPVASFTMLDKPRKAGSIGYPVWGVEMGIVDEHDNLLPDGERGEIVIRGHNIMKGYLNRPDANKETLRNGWFHSGDIGFRDADGCYFIVDRKKDMILRGGFNVYPREVEEVLYAHAAVAEAAVIGVAHESHGEEVKAVVALKPGQSASPDELIAFCKERLAAYKYPRQVEIVDALPKGPTGKILKRELK
jgi:long-chain acyl-CoA synthetase